MSDLFTPKVGTLLECGMPCTGYGIVVSCEARRNEDGDMVIRTSILWCRNGISEVDDLRIANGDRTWRMIRKLSPGELELARARFEDVFSVIRERDERAKRISHEINLV